MSNKIITLDGLNTFLSNVKTYLTELLLSKQDKLISGENIVTINGNSILTSSNVIAGNIGTVDTGLELIDPNDYKSKYFTIEALENGLTAKLSTNACEYRIDDGAWTTLPANTNTPNINKGQTLSFRGNLKPNSSNGIGTFTISNKCNLKGNIMSLLYGNDFIDKIDLTGKSCAFYNLFKNCTNIVDVSKLILPATTLANYCYYSMFYGCTGLTTAPELPATKLAYNCYSRMFQGCTGLTTTPKLPATTLANSCYSYMFCGCTGLTTAPELPATTLANSCYNSMFEGCKGLITAPELPATTLASSCYYYMFAYCSKLNYIVMLATDISATDCLRYWVSGVASTGTFVKHPDMASLPKGTNGIPYGWGIAYNNSGFCIVNPNTSKTVVFYDEFGKLYTPSNKAKNLYDTMTDTEIMSLKPECDIKVTVVVNEKDAVIKNQLWSNTQDFYQFSGISIGTISNGISITINEILSPDGDYGY